MSDQKEIKLTDKQKQFCEEYLIDLNATQSAIRAGYSEKTAYSIGGENLNKPEIKEYIGELKKKRSEIVSLSQQDILKELKNFAYSDITKTINLTPDEVKALPVEIRRMIVSYEHTIDEYEGRTIERIKLKFADKLKVFEMLNKHTGFYEEDNKQIGDAMNRTELTAEQVKRIAEQVEKEI